MVQLTSAAWRTRLSNAPTIAPAMIAFSTRPPSTSRNCNPRAPPSSRTRRIFRSFVAVADSATPPVVRTVRSSTREPFPPFIETPTAPPPTSRVVRS